MIINIEITKRLEWLAKRIKLSDVDKDYILFQMKDISTETAKQILGSDKHKDSLGNAITSFDEITDVERIIVMDGYCKLCGSKLKDLSCDKCNDKK